MITFTVPGEPATKGSFRAFTVRRANGKIGARVDNDNPRCKPWQEAITWAARQAMGRARLFAPYVGIVRVTAYWRFTPPKKTKLLKPPHDIDKLLRVVLDGMSKGVVYVDDKQVVTGPLDKDWCRPGEQPGVAVTLEPVDVPDAGGRAKGGG